MTALLVSVRNEIEAAEAIAGQAHIIDVKEPNAGSLGRATPATWVSVRELCHRHIESANGPDMLLSAACGELVDCDDHRMEGLAGYSFAKIGLAGCRSLPDWQSQWNEWVKSLPEETAPVRVLYADYRTVDAPGPRELFELKSGRESNVFLVDTYDKSHGDLFAHLTWCELVDVVHEARELGFKVALAGSINERSLEDALRLEPDWIAVRGAACTNGRNSAVDRRRVLWLTERLRSAV